jgi:hypothetical protein
MWWRCAGQSSVLTALSRWPHAAIDDGDDSVEQALGQVCPLSEPSNPFRQRACGHPRATRGRPHDVGSRLKGLDVGLLGPDRLGGLPEGRALVRGEVAFDDAADTGAP